MALSGVMREQTQKRINQEEAMMRGRKTMLRRFARDNTNPEGNE